MLNDFMPAIVFFAVYKMYDIFYATAALIIITIAQVIFEYHKTKKIPQMQVAIAVLVVIFGGATLYFHDEEFIKWKVSIVNWVLGIGFIATTYLMKQTPVEKLMGSAMDLPHTKWKILNNVWGVYFLILGFVNIAVAYLCSTEVWMNFKLFGMLGLTFAFLIIQSIYLSKHIKK